MSKTLTHTTDDGTIQMVDVADKSETDRQAVAEARSNTILFLNNDVEFLDEDTLAEMLSRLVEPDVGAVGIDAFQRLLVDVTDMDFGATVREGFCDGASNAGCTR